MKVKLEYIGKTWTHGENYSVNCEMCQPRNAGLYRMLPLPTIKVKVSYDEKDQYGGTAHYDAECWLCKGCIDRGVANGELDIVNPEPAGCPFAA